MWDDEDEARAVGLVLDAGRGSLPYALVHGESLVACAAWALGEAGVALLDASVTWPDVVRLEAPLVLHDSLCPLAPPRLLAACVARSLAEGAPVVAGRPVTDTVKEVREQDGRQLLGDTVDRDRLRAVASPLVVPGALLGRLELPLDRPLEDLVAAVGAVADLVWVDAPPEARRVGSEADLRVLEALTAR